MPAFDWLNNGQTTASAMAALYAKLGVPDREPKEYGYALMLSNKEGHQKVDHGGGIPGFNAHLSEFPKDHITVAVLANAEDRHAEIFLELGAALVPADAFTSRLDELSLRESEILATLPHTSRVH